MNLALVQAMNAAVARYFPTDSKTEMENLFDVLADFIFQYFKKICWPFMIHNSLNHSLDWLNILRRSSVILFFVFGLVLVGMQLMRYVK